MKFNINVNEEMGWREIDANAKGGAITSPETSKAFETGTWRTNRPVWIEENCKQCTLCWPTCPEDAIPIDEKNKKRIDFDYTFCKGCGICAAVCPFKAIEMKIEE